MVINMNGLHQTGQPDREDFLRASLLKLIASKRQHHFVILCQHKDEQLTAAKNTTIVITKNYTSKIAKAFWYQYQLPAVLKKVKANVFINVGTACSLQTTVPQCLLFTRNSPSLNVKKTAENLRKAAQVVTDSQSLKNELCQQYNVAENKVHVMYSLPARQFLPLSQEAKELCKEQNTDGKEYFLYVGPLSATSYLINLLKAFSFFKKRQQSNMQLVIAATDYVEGNELEKSLQTYKYRDDVRIVRNPDVEQLASLTGSAYVFVYPLPDQAAYLSVLQAMKAGVPVVAANSLLMHEICGEAALFAEPEVFESIADKMMLLFKDEQLRDDLITKGFKQAAGFEAQRTNELWWNLVKNCVAQKV